MNQCQTLAHALVTLLKQLEVKMTVEHGTSLTADDQDYRMNIAVPTEKLHDAAAAATVGKRDPDRRRTR